MFKYAKPYLWLFGLSILLLYIQANADLSLPNYLSNIVDVGIQQDGISHAVPSAIRESQMDWAMLFMAPENKSIVLNDFTLVNATSTLWSKYVDQYPALSNQSVYILNENVNDTEINRLDPIMANSLMVVNFFQSAQSNQTLSDEVANITQGNIVPYGIAMPILYLQLQVLLKNLPPAAYANLTSGFTSKIASIGESLIIQAAAANLKSEYKALGVDVGQMQQNYIWHVGGQMILLTLLSMACTITVSFIAARVAAGMSRDIRRAEFVKVEGFSSAEFDKFSTASLMTRSTNDITQIQQIVFILIRMVFYAPIIGVWGIIYALEKAASMWYIIAISVLMLVTIVLVVFKMALPKFMSIQGLIDRLTLVGRENLSGMMVIRAFNMQGAEEKRFDKANIDITKVSMFINVLMVVVMPLMMLIMNGITVWIVWTGSHEVSTGTIQVGDMIAFMQYTIQICFAFLMMSLVFLIAPRAVVSASRVCDVLSTEEVIKDPANPKTLADPIEGVVEFHHVSFRYPGAEADVLHDINFISRPGETTAIIGPTGSGKSTVMSLIPRLYDVTAGAILLDGVDIRQLAQHDLRQHIGYVPQKAYLFSGTILSNLRYGKRYVSDEAVELAVNISQSAEIIKEKPDGLKTEIAQGGMNVSGGQKQRLSIGRALSGQPQIYILDDSTSALDFKTDAALRRALKQYTGNATVFLVSQRVSTIMHAEQIIVLDEGRIVGIGTHEQLLETCPTYAEIANSQHVLEEFSQ
ncbi:MAG TPA: ABC transporter ATP-binding protein [Candidatus Lokiarchaeia archaeon]|nr:ABC transporter ATP-binding protein [Candidatus Lokiarchaeia archaeon]